MNQKVGMIGLGIMGSALAKGWPKKDSSAVCGVLEDMAGLERSRK
jgi:3-hydroxyisobutyrate dehydrogenase-like beta-hydroxyacid dehydrogenase